MMCLISLTNVFSSKTSIAILISTIVFLLLVAFFYNCMVINFKKNLLIIEKLNGSRRVNGKKIVWIIPFFEKNVCSIKQKETIHLIYKSYKVEIEYEIVDAIFLYGIFGKDINSQLKDYILASYKFYLSNRKSASDDYTSILKKVFASQTLPLTITKINMEELEK